MNFNGVVLLSSVLDFSTIAGGPGDDLAFVTFLPTEAAVRWYHDKSPRQRLAGGCRQGSARIRKRSLRVGTHAGRSSPARSVREDCGRARADRRPRRNYIELADLRVQPQRFIRNSNGKRARPSVALTGVTPATIWIRSAILRTSIPPTRIIARRCRPRFFRTRATNLNWKSDETVPSNASATYSKRGTSRASRYSVGLPRRLAPIFSKR